MGCARGRQDDRGRPSARGRDVACDDAIACGQGLKAGGSVIAAKALSAGCGIQAGASVDCGEHGRRLGHDRRRGHPRRGRHPRGEGIQAQGAITAGPGHGIYAGLNDAPGRLAGLRQGHRERASQPAGQRALGSAGTGTGLTGPGARATASRTGASRRAGLAPSRYRAGLSTSISPSRIAAIPTGLKTGSRLPRIRKSSSAVPTGTSRTGWSR